MAGSVSGMMHAPLTGVFLAAEITGGYALMVPLMVVSAIAYFINKGIRKYSIYTKGLAEQGELITAEDKDHGILARIRLGPLVRPGDVVLAPGDTPLSRKADIIRSERTIFPVVEGDGRFAGIVSIEQLLEALYGHGQDGRMPVMAELVQPMTEVARPDTAASDALQAMEKRGTHLLPVVDAEQRYVGFITRQAIFSQYRKLLVEQGDLV